MLGKFLFLSRYSSTRILYAPRIIVHLGAAFVPKESYQINNEFAIQAVKTGQHLALQGKYAEDIVTAAIEVLENCPVSDAGIGSVF